MKEIKYLKQKQKDGLACCAICQKSCLLTSNIDFILQVKGKMLMVHSLLYPTNILEKRM